MQIAYFDIHAGISGEIVLAAFISAGLPISIIQETIAKIQFTEPWSITAQSSIRSGLPVTIVTIDVLINKTPVELHTTHPSQTPTKLYTYSSILEMISTSNVSPLVKKLCINLLSLLETAQNALSSDAKSNHCLTRTQAIETLVECVGIAVGIEYFTVEAIYVSPLSMGHNRPEGEHIAITSLSPVVLSLLAKSRIPINPTIAKLQLVTPVGAAFLCTAATSDRPMISLRCTGTGGGHLTLGWPNQIQLFIGILANQVSHNYVLIETNIDDMAANALGFFAEKLWSAGALDVFFTAVQMKKGRPGTKLSIIANETSEHSLAMLILNETTTFGVRCVPIRKYEASRTLTSVLTEFGAVRVKIKKNMGIIVGVWPEYDDCAKLSREHNIPFLEIYNSTLLKARSLDLTDGILE